MKPWYEQNARDYAEYERWRAAFIREAAKHSSYDLIDMSPEQRWTPTRNVHSLDARRGRYVDTKA